MLKTLEPPSIYKQKKYAWHSRRIKIVFHELFCSFRRIMQPDYHGAFKWRAKKILHD